MLEVDLHVHSLFSACGLHTILELCEQGRKTGLTAMAITDHGPAVSAGHHLTSVFFERFQLPFKGMKLYKGLELNLLDETGKVDMAAQYMPFVDILLFGVHPNIAPHKPEEYYTGMVLAAMENNPVLDILSHPNDPAYPLDYRRVAETAAQKGIALELNNSKILYKRSTCDDALALIFACKEAGCRMAVNSDTHALLELGRDEAVRPLLEQAEFPGELIVNRNLETADAFIEERKKYKRLPVRHN